MDGASERYSHLGRPARIGALRLPHRMLMGSMHLGIEGDDQTLDRIIRFYEERVRGGAALIITGGAAVHHSGWEPHRFLLSEDRHRRDLFELASAVHRANGRIALQLFHAGRYARSSHLGYAPWGPSPIPSRVTREVPQAMNLSQISSLVAAYHDAAKFAAESGFDGVEVMGSEGYLLNSFLSALTNQRTDRYAGVDGGLNLIVEIIQAVREGLGSDVALIFRASGWDAMGSAADPALIRILTQQLAEAGVDALNVGIGWHESQMPTVSQWVPQGAFAEIARQVRESTILPTMGANRIADHALADRLIAEGMMDFVAPARPWLADPFWARRALEGGLVNPCIACNQACLDRSLAQPPQPISCTVNPRALEESRYPIQRTAMPLSVAVIGAGPAGLEAAKASAELGHRVTLYEASDEIGGQMRWAMKVPGKEEFAGTLRYFRRILDDLGVQILCNTTPDLCQLSRDADAVFIATGVKPVRPDVPGINLPHVIDYPEAFAHPESLRGDIVIVGGGGVGLDLALFLSAPHGRALRTSPSFWEEFPTAHATDVVGRSITVLARHRAGKSVGRTTRWILRDVLSRLGVHVREYVDIEAISTEGIAVIENGTHSVVKANYVLIATGQIPNLPVSPTPPGFVFTIGGARDADGLDAVRAIREGLDAAYQLFRSDVTIPKIERGDL